MAEVALDIVINAVDNASGKLGGIGKVAGGLALGGLAALGGAAVAVGKAAFDMSMEYDAAMDALTIATGKTGDALDDMGATVQSLYGGQGGRGGRGLQDIAEVLGTVSQRTRLTGTDLEGFTEQLFRLSNLTDTDANANLDTMTKLMAQFNIDAKEGAATMDLLFGSAQQSGMGFDELTASLQKFAPVGQAFGLGMEDQIEQIIMFKEAGVDAQTMTVALRTAQQALAKDGIEPTAEALGDIFFKIVEAETETEKLSIATEYFGTKAAPTMLTALENSNSLMDTMAYGLDETTGALEATTTATEGWEETWTSAMNNMKLALIPLGDTFKNFLDENAEGFTEWITNSLVPGINTAVSKINELINTMSDGQGLLDLGGGEGSVFNQQHGQSNLTQGIIDYMKGSDYWTTYNPGIIEMLERGKQNQLSLETGNQYGGPEAIVNPYNIINVYGDVNDPQMFEQMTRGQGVR